MSPIQWQQSSCTNCGSWQQMLYEDQAKGCQLATVPVYPLAGGIPLGSPVFPYRDAPLLLLYIGLFWVVPGVGRHPSTGPQCPGTKSQDKLAPWWWVPPLGLIWVMAPSVPSRWQACVHSCLLQQHAETFAGTGTHSGGCHVPTAAVLAGRHQHPTAILHLLWRCFPILPTSWQQQFSGSCSHITN